LKKAMEPYLPNEILYRPKMGFAVPLKAWFRGPLSERARQIVSASTLVESGIFNVPFLRSLVEEHQSGAADHSAAIWSLMIFESFLRNVHCRTFESSAPLRDRAAPVAG